MTTTKYLMVLTALGLGLTAVGCSSSSSSCSDGGACAGAGGHGGAAGGTTGAAGASGLGGAGGGPVLYALSPGNFCFDVVSVAPGTVDGCDNGAADFVTTATTRAALSVIYYDTATTVGGVAIPAGTVEVGTDGSLGRGVINQNQATLLRDSTVPAPAPNQACTWHQTDTSQFQLTATNQFTISVTETQSTFTAACTTAQLAPATDPCTSTWTWTLAIEDPQVLTAPGCGNN